MINVYVCAADGAPGDASALANGFHIRHWSNAQMSFWVVSELESKELDQFVELFQARTR